MRKLLFSLIAVATLLTAGINDAKAQAYKNAMLELIGNFRSNKGYDYIRLTGLYEVYNPINGAAGLSWYYGGGATIGSIKAKGFDGDVYLGANGVLGLDYKFNGAPINLSLDWIPTLQLTPSTNFYSGDVGLGVRFTF